MYPKTQASIKNLIAAKICWITLNSSFFIFALNNNRPDSIKWDVYKSKVYAFLSGQTPAVIVIIKGY